MRDGVIHFSDVTFAMPGARVNVAGRYVMKAMRSTFAGPSGWTRSSRV